MTVNLHFKEQTSAPDNKVFSLKSNYRLVYLLLFIGVVVHELSHYIMCKIMGVRVYEFSIQNPLKISTEQDTLGFVSYGSTNSFKKSLIINIAPILLNPVCGIVILYIIITSSLSILFTLITIPIFILAIPSEPDLENITNTVTSPKGILYVLIMKLVFLVSYQHIVYKVSVGVTLYSISIQIIAF